MRRTVGVFVGSLRSGSFTRKVAQVLAGLAPSGLALEVIEIGQLPLYNPDLDGADPPAAWTAFRGAVRPLDALLFVTPEYNRSLPAALKNALDVGSRPSKQSVWDGKPGAVVSVSPGALGGFGAHHHLRQTLAHLNVSTLAQPELYLGGVADLLDESGALTKDSTRALLTRFLGTFAVWIERNPAPGRT
ncbi:MAG: NADPH-dependent FMN reductase [Gemmatimonadales bacterium]